MAKRDTIFPVHRRYKKLRGRPVTLDVVLTGKRKYEVYFESVIKAFHKLSPKRKEKLLKRFCSIETFVRAEQLKKRPGKIVFCMTPSKELLRFVSAIGAAHLNKRWKKARKQ